MHGASGWHWSWQIPTLVQEIHRTYLGGIWTGTALGWIWPCRRHCGNFQHQYLIFFYSLAIYRLHSLCQYSWAFITQLHQLIKGTFKNHLVTWIVKYIEDNNSNTRCDCDQIWIRIPMFIPSIISHLPLVLVCSLLVCSHLVMRVDLLLSMALRCL